MKKKHNNNKKLHLLVREIIYHHGQLRKKKIVSSPVRGSCYHCSALSLATCLVSSTLFVQITTNSVCNVQTKLNLCQQRRRQSTFQNDSNCLLLRRILLWWYMISRTSRWSFFIIFVLFFIIFYRQLPLLRQHSATHDESSTMMSTVHFQAPLPILRPPPLVFSLYWPFSTSTAHFQPPPPNFSLYHPSNDHFHPS